MANTTPSDLAVSLYAAGATIESGSFIGDAGHTANDLSSWTTVTPATPQIRAGGTATATVTIAVPTDATAGEQYAIVWAEVRSAGAGGVTEVNRVGIRIYLSVGSGAAPAASFTIDSLTAGRSPQGNPVVIAAVHNTGGTRARHQRHATTLRRTGRTQRRSVPCGTRRDPGSRSYRTSDGYA